MPILLIQRDEGPEEMVVLDRPTVTIGRNHEASGIHNDIHLPGRIVSRRHARIALDRGIYFIEDLRSENHIFVNDQQVSRAPLAHGDRISIGPHTIVFEDQDVKTVDPGSFQVGSLDAESTMDLNYLILHNLSGLLVKVTSVAEFLEAAMSLIMESIRASSGVLVITNPDGTHKEFVTRGRPVGWSESMIKEAIRAKKSMLAGHDFSLTETMQSRGAQSALCAPLIHEGNVLGAVYLEDPLPGRFGEDKLILLTVIANQIAAGLEKAALNERLYKEILTRKSLERFLSPRVAERVAADCAAQGKLALATDRLNATILFADIQGFTLLSERLDAGEIASLLTDYFTLMTEIIFKWEGTLDKYLGDGLLAIFGAPFTCIDHGVRAVKCGLEMLQEQTRFVQELPPNKRFAIRIGINTGEVVAGYLGSPQRMEYTVLGENVVIAYRLQSLAEPGSIYLGRSTYELIKDTYEVRYVDRMTTPKGRKEIEVYRLFPDASAGKR
jgi:adenylate cyclase